MLSFMIGMGHAASRALSHHGAAIESDLARRSFRSSTHRAHLEGPTRWMLSGALDSAIPSGRWALLFSDLSHKDPTPDFQSFLKGLHQSLQKLSATDVASTIERMATVREEEGLWLAWCESENILLAWRDPLGKVPLYYLEHEQGVLIGNSRQSFEHYLQDQPFDDEETLASLLITGAPGNGRTTGFRRFQRVEAGGMVRLSTRHAPIHRRWWTWSSPVIKAIDADRAVEQYRSLLQKSVASAGAFPQTHLELSGGMDSSAVLAALSTLQPRPSLTTITFATHEDDEELLYARRSSQSLGFAHRRVDDVSRPDDLFPSPRTGGSLSRNLEAFGSPDIPTEIFSGHGGDNLFRVSKQDVRRMRRELSPLRQVQYWELHRRIHGQLPPMFLRNPTTSAQAQRELESRRFPFLSEPFQSLVKDTYLYNILDTQQRSPRESMVYSPRWTNMFEVADAGFHGWPLQYRYPYFNLPLIRFLASIPPLPYLHQKHLARTAWQELLPTEVTQRPKTLADIRSVEQRIRAATIGFNSTELPSWVQADALQRFLTHPEKFPIWIYPYALGLLDLLRWLDLRKRS